MITEDTNLRYYYHGELICKNPKEYYLRTRSYEQLKFEYDLLNIDKIDDEDYRKLILKIDKNNGEDYRKLILKIDKINQFYYFLPFLLFWIFILYKITTLIIA